MITVPQQRTIYVVTDWLTTSLAWFGFNVFRYFDHVSVSQPYPSLKSFLSVTPVWSGQILFPLMMLCIYTLSGYYNRVYFKSRIEELLNTFWASLLGTIIIYFIAIIDDPIPDRISNYALLMMLWVMMFSVVYIGRLSITLRAQHRLRSGKLKFNALIIGNREAAERLSKRLETMPLTSPQAYNIVGVVVTDFTDADTEHGSGKSEAGTPQYTMLDLQQLIAENDIKALIVTSHSAGMMATMQVINRLFAFNLPILLSPTLQQLLIARPRIGNLAGEPLLDITRANISDFTLNIKRLADIIVSTIALILLSPAFVAIAIGIKADSRGPVFFRQVRIGRHKKPFTIVKFRTMRTDAEASGPALSSENDPRITSMGRFLRKYRIDELPQFWNVLRGDMSIIGPRPERAFYIDKIMEEAPYYTLVHQVRPGITSLGMVKYGYASTVEQMIQRLQYDIIYLDNISMLSDLKIIIYTVATVLHGKGL